MTIINKAMLSDAQERVYKKLKGNKGSYIQTSPWLNRQKVMDKDGNPLWWFEQKTLQALVSKKVVAFDKQGVIRLL
jgi:hypothetical protein